MQGRNQKGGGGKERVREGQNEKAECMFNQTHRRRKQQNETEEIHEEIMAIT